MRSIGKPRIRRWATGKLIRLALAFPTASRGWAAVALLQRRGSPEMLAIIAALARHTSARRRVLAMDIAAQLRPPGHSHDYQVEPYAVDATQAVLLAGLRDEDPRVVRSAVSGLGHRPTAAALHALVDHERHADATVRFALACALPSYPEPEATAALLRLAADRDESVREWATFGIGTLGEADDDAIRTLLWQNAHDTDRDVRGEAVVGLARRSDPRVIDLLKTRLLDADCRVYELEAVEEMPSPKLLDTLLRVRDDAERVRDLDPTWYSHLIDALDACELVADPTP